MSRGALQTSFGSGQLERALERVQFMESAASLNFYLSLLHACSKSKNPSHVKQVHAHLSLHKIQLAGLLGDYLVVSLAKCGVVDDAIATSLGLPCRTVFSWTAIITACLDNGQNIEALRLQHVMKDDGVFPDSFTLVSLIKACANTYGLHPGKQLHVAALWQGFASDVYVGSALVHMYGKCGAFMEAELFFSSMRVHTVVSWTALLSAYVEGGQGVKALQLYRQMHHESVDVDQLAVMLAIQACCLILEDQDPEERPGVKLANEVGSALHADARKKSFISDVYLANTLVNFYGKCGSIKHAEQVFQAVVQCDIVSSNAMLSAYVEQGQAQWALQLYIHMHHQHANPDKLTFVFAFQACASLAEKGESSSYTKGLSMKYIALQIGQLLHADACMRGFASDGFIRSSLVKMYGKCGAVFESEHIFTMASHHDITSWNSLLSVYVDHAQESSMIQEVHQSQVRRPLLLFRQMQREGVVLDRLAYGLALQACNTLADKYVEEETDKTMPFEIGQALHADALREGFSSGSYIGNRLMSMYGKCGAVRQVEHMFYSISNKTVSAWNALVFAYVEQGQSQKALQLFWHMLKQGFQPDKWTFVILFQVCAILGEAELPDRFPFSNKAIVLELGHAFHEDAVKRGFTLDAFVGSTLISMYGKCGAIMEAEQAFNTLLESTIVTRTALISAYVEQNQGNKALQMYRQMLKQGMLLNCVTFIIALQACSATGSVESCKQVHFDIVSAGCDHLPTVAATLICAYGRCTSMVDAHTIFSRFDEPGIVLWNSFISGLAEVGDFAEVLHMYEKLRDAGIAPDKITFTVILSACRHTGLVGKGLEYFQSMSADYGLVPDSRHYGSMMDLLGRVGDFQALTQLWSKMPMQADFCSWQSFLFASSTYGNVEMARQAYNHARALQPGEANSYVLMSKVYADAGLLET